MRNYKTEFNVNHLGHRCVGLFTDIGHRCGYVGIKETNQLYGLKMGHLLLDALDVHGGITFSGKYLFPDEIDDNWWLGFDCGHCDDSIDKDALKSYFPNSPFLKFPEIFTHGVIRTERYVKLQCFDLVEQLIKSDIVVKKINKPTIRIIRI